MMGMFIEPGDLAPFATIDSAKAAAMIKDAEAKAILTSPCLATLSVTPDGETAAELALRQAKIDGVKAILREALLRWEAAGAGVVQTTQTGPFGQTIDTTKPRRGMFWPSEITELQNVCRGADAGKAFSIDTVGPDSAHLPWCSLNFGATYCSCGVDIAGEPIFEL